MKFDFKKHEDNFVSLVHFNCDFLSLFDQAKIELVMVVLYPIPSEGWGRGATLRRFQNRARPHVHIRLLVLALQSTPGPDLQDAQRGLDTFRFLQRSNGHFVPISGENQVFLGKKKFTLRRLVYDLRFQSTELLALSKSAYGKSGPAKNSFSL